MIKYLLAFILLFPITALADECYIGQWEWHVPNEAKDEFGAPSWRAPLFEQSKASLDLRTLPQMSKKGITEGHGVFCYPNAVSSPLLLISLGDPDDGVGLLKRRAIKNRLKLGDSLRSTKVKEVLYELLTEKADPTGITGPKPIMPDRKLRMKLLLGKRKVKDIALIPFVSPEWDKVLAVLHNDYKGVADYDQVLAGKWLDYQQEKYGVHYATFIPEDAPIKVAALPHSTDITESFNTAASDTLGPDLTWTEVDTDLDIGSAATCFTNPGTSDFAVARADSVLSGSDQYAHVTPEQSCWSSYGPSVGAIVRKDNTGTLTYYFANYSVSNFSNHYGQIRKSVGGSFTTITSDVVDGGATCQEKVLRIEVDGSNQEIFWDGASENTGTDTAISSGNYAGINAWATSHPRPGGGDVFGAGDLAAGAAAYIPEIMVY